MTMWRGTTGRSASRRARRRDTVRLLRAQGRHGPEFREVLPALTVLVLVLCAGVAGLAAGYRALGVVVPFVFLALLAVVVPLAVRALRPAARRRRGRYTTEEIAALDAAGLASAVSRMLRRDGWSVRPPSGDRVRPRVRARHPRGHRLEVVFRPVAEPLPDEDPPGAGPPLLLIVHRGTFSARDARWARHRAGTRLMDGALLRRWADGTPLDRLVDLR
ncbi:hypothetical protein AB0E75_24500 [Streptomyces griseoviridis]|uniref:Uncharacterized protein n=1 Tax=Streptomyces griseoviridis TaxID=45398 RepID=A0A918GVQ1_STRGD|nr:hypothetical protein [Streptomyces niveoruber]GGS63108.1 hypothetical protein GCM10010238_60270 [Streptomyces niveoruber]